MNIVLVAGFYHVISEIMVSPHPPSFIRSQSPSSGKNGIDTKSNDESVMKVWLPKRGSLSLYQ